MHATRNAYVNKFHPKNGGGAKSFFFISLLTESNNIFELPVCLHAFCALFDITWKMSQYLRKHETSTLFGPIQHGNCNAQNLKQVQWFKMKTEWKQRDNILKSILDTYGEL